jgi:hypothetical protein
MAGRALTVTFRLGRQSEDDVEMNGLSKAQDEARVPIGCEPCLLHRDFVGTHGKLLCPKKTLLIRAYTARLIGQRVMQRNFCVGNSSAAGVTRNALKSCSKSRRLSTCVDCA